MNEKLTPEKKQQIEQAAAGLNVEPLLDLINWKGSTVNGVLKFIDTVQSLFAMAKLILPDDAVAALEAGLQKVEDYLREKQRTSQA